MSNLPWSLLHHRLLSCLSSCNHLEMSRINPDLHLSKLYSTQLHWHLFHLVAQVNISVPFFCGHSTNFPLMKQLALLVPHIYSQLFRLPNIPRVHLITLPITLLEKGLFTSWGTLLITQFPIYFLGSQYFLQFYRSSLEFYFFNNEILNSKFPFFYTFCDVFYVCLLSLFCFFEYPILKTFTVIWYLIYIADLTVGFLPVIFPSIKCIPLKIYNAISCRFHYQYKATKF